MLIAYWIIAGLLALVYMAAGGMKVAQPPAKLAASGLAWAGDFPVWTVKMIGLVEVIGGIGLLLPTLTGIAAVLSPIAAVGLAVVQLGAIITHLVRGEAKMLPANFVLLLLAVAAAWIGFPDMGVTSSGWQVPSLATAGSAPDGTQMAAVELLVSDLDAMTRFYQEAVTLDVLDQSGATATLGRPGTPIVTLRQEKDLLGPDRTGAGLYHTAILFKDEPALASAVASVAQRAPGVFEGSADHHVSEAFYFHDPEGNGLELYRDRPREEWSIRPDGTIVMGVDPLDPNAFLRTWYTPDAPAPEGAIGHVHLQVKNIDLARRFYVDILGFDITAQIGTALFVSAGGYHHHIGVNTWNSAGAGPRAASLGLGDVRITVPTRSDIDALADRLRFHGIPAADDGRSLRFEDPWGTRLAVTPAT